MRWTALASVLGLLACRTSTPVDDLLAQHSEAMGAMREIGPGLAVACEPPEAEVAIDGVLQGTCGDLAGRVLALGEGPHRVEVKRMGFRPYEAQVAAGKARTSLKVQLVPTS